MTENKLYTVIKGKKDSEDQEGHTVSVKPTEYLASLPPADAIGELQAFVQSLAEDLEECSKQDMEIPENVERLRDLVFEVEIAQGYLANVLKAWQATKKGNEHTPPPPPPG